MPRARRPPGVPGDVGRPRMIAHKPLWLPDWGYTAKAKQKVIGIGGIADNQVFESYLKSNFEVVEFYEFVDHHDYKSDEINKIVEVMAHHEAMLVTTEKDFIKLGHFKNLIAKSCFYLPIEIKFIKGQSTFFKLVDDTMKKYPKY